MLIGFVLMVRIMHIYYSTVSSVRIEVYYIVLFVIWLSCYKATAVSTDSGLAAVRREAASSLYQWGQLVWYTGPGENERI